MNLPPEFIQTIKNSFGTDGEAWLSTLPDLITEASYRWGLTDIQPLPSLSYNFVAMAQSGASDSERSRSACPATTGFDTVRVPHVDGARVDGARAVSVSVRDGKLNPPIRTEVILKLGVPNRELTSEIAALRLYNGRGACRLLDADAEKGMLLLERLQPGRMLSTLKDNEQATRIAADVMSKLWRPVPETIKDFILLKDWFDGFKRLR